jgi:peptide deformylase
MVLDIVMFGHPALRAKGARVERVDSKVRGMVEDMLETMYAADGVGLAAQQVGLPLQLCVIDVGGVEDRPSWMTIDSRRVDLDENMPMVLINPLVEALGEMEVGVEGCLSFPGIRADIGRPGRVRVKAQSLDGTTLVFEAGGLLARAVQHEFDHLNGVLFIDRMAVVDRKRLQAEIDAIGRGA